ncbi:TfpX/TfpZ family type IV pilin accessory protein [Solimicrobium silvestre]|uniref:Type IV pilin accessory protein n=1 Tax=Solimicrobium silvestre TaxID=2099400 RepID=A0A2S9GTG1_9BURK|nr:TfpX/TfpZ family type IV pilin accessory protein [Solimicrobium silvestre]PRC91000.1 hypothetical protein S2091_4296 [Solimicrobium silvestre]
MKMNRFQASALHLFGSACFLAVFFLMVSQVWYPGKLFSAAAGVELLRLLICVDLIIGPLVTLIIFNPQKKKLKQDLIIVVLCQLGFLFYGVWSIYTVRPVYIAFAENKFYMVRANEIDATDQAKVTDTHFKSLPVFGPEYVGTQEPTDPKIKNDIVFSSLAGMGIQNLPQYFVPLNKIQQQIKAAAKTSQEWKTIDAETKQRLKSYERENAGTSVSFIALINKRIALFVVINAQTGEIIGII